MYLPIYKVTTPKDDFFREKSVASGGTRTHDTLLSRPSALPTELLRYIAQLAGTNLTSNQGKARQGKASQPD